MSEDFNKQLEPGFYFSSTLAFWGGIALEVLCPLARQEAGQMSAWRGCLQWRLFDGRHTLHGPISSFEVDSTTG